MHNIPNEELWTCIKALGLGNRTNNELAELAKKHEPNQEKYFASAVIVKACNQLMAFNKAVKSEWKL